MTGMLIGLSRQIAHPLGGTLVPAEAGGVRTFLPDVKSGRSLTKLGKNIIHQKINFVNIGSF